MRSTLAWLIASCLAGCSCSDGGGSSAAPAGGQPGTGATSSSGGSSASGGAGVSHRRGTDAGADADRPELRLRARAGHRGLQVRLVPHPSRLLRDGLAERRVGPRRQHRESGEGHAHPPVPDPAEDDLRPTGSPSGLKNPSSRSDQPGPLRATASSPLAQSAT